MKKLLLIALLTLSACSKDEITECTKKSTIFVDGPRIVQLFENGDRYDLGGVGESYVAYENSCDLNPNVTR